MEKLTIKTNYQLKDLPPHLQRKYKNSVLFQKENIQRAKKFQFDLKKLKERKAEKQKTIQEKLEQFKINPTEQKYLLNVFNQISKANSHQFFTKVQICDVLKKMQIKMTNSQIDRMIWQFDQKLDKKITVKEFVNMYKKCTIDKAAAESKNLFHLTQFLMFCRPNYYNITVQDTLQLLYVRAKIQGQAEKKDEKQILEEQIKVIFGDQQKTPEGVQKQIGFKQYLQKINKRAIQKRKEDILKAKANLKY